MRVITGTARGRRLLTLEGEDVRPTTDRVKEAVFSIIQFETEGRAFLDLFAGSGQMGIEALSRGAKEAVFVDSAKKSVGIIRENLASTNLAQNAKVCQLDWQSFLSMNTAKFDTAFLDPPYGKGLEITALAALRQEGLLAEDGVAIIETTIGADLTPYLKAGYRVSRIKEYKSNQHLFLTVWKGDL